MKCWQTPPRLLRRLHSLDIYRTMSVFQSPCRYNLAAMSHVAVSFEMAEYTGNVDGLGTLRLLDAIRTCGLEGTTRVYVYGMVLLLKVGVSSTPSIPAVRRDRAFSTKITDCPLPLSFLHLSFEFFPGCVWYIYVPFFFWFSGIGR